jgi:hypothetical protein
MQWGLAAGGIVVSGWTFLNFFSFYVHPVDKNTGQYIRTEGKDKDSWQLAISSWQEIVGSEEAEKRRK